MSPRATGVGRWTWEPHQSTSFPDAIRLNKNMTCLSWDMTCLSWDMKGLLWNMTGLLWNMTGLLSDAFCWFPVVPELRFFPPENNHFSGARVLLKNGTTHMDCMCVYIYIGIYVYVNIYLCIYISIYMYIHMDPWCCVVETSMTKRRRYVYESSTTYIYIYAKNYVFTHMYVLINTPICVNHRWLVNDEDT